jgi:peptidoglycan hydrolase CwlO-like protein
VTLNHNYKESQSKITEVESGIQGVGNLFDYLKTVCEKNRNAVAKTEDQYEVLNGKWNKNKSDIKKLSEKVDIVNNSNYGLRVTM